MAYTKITDYAVKDSLLSGNPSKIVRGVEIDADFAAIETADAQNLKTGQPATVSSLTDSGNLTFTGTGNRITGDFSNATVANRVTFQTSTVNGSSVVGVIPNGTGTISQFAAYGSADPANSQVTRVDVRGGVESRIESTYAGTPSSGTYLPMTFYTGGAERVRIDASGNVGIGGANTSGQKLDIRGGSWGNNQNIGLTVATPSGANGWLCGVKLKSDGSGIPRLAFDYPKDSTFANSEGLIIDTTGNVLANSGTGGLGYGTGAGGTVTQATSKTTAVTLNKPTGTITMNAASLASGATATFLLSNSLIAYQDVVVISADFAGGNYQAWPVAQGAGSVYISVKNNSAGALTDAVTLHFAIIKGATA